MSGHLVGGSARTVEEEAAQDPLSSSPRMEAIPPYAGPGTSPQDPPSFPSMMQGAQKENKSEMHPYGTPGHIFVVHGDLSKLACDAWMVS